MGYLHLIWWKLNLKLSSSVALAVFPNAPWPHRASSYHTGLCRDRHFPHAASLLHSTGLQLFLQFQLARENPEALLKCRFWLDRFEVRPRIPLLGDTNAAGLPSTWGERGSIVITETQSRKGKDFPNLMKAGLSRGSLQTIVYWALDQGSSVEKQWQREFSEEQQASSDDCWMGCTTLTFSTTLGFPNSNPRNGFHQMPTHQWPSMFRILEGTRILKEFLSRKVE